MFSIPRHVDGGNSEYLASAEYPVLTKQKKTDLFPNIAGAPSVYTEPIACMSRSCLQKNS